VQALIVQSSNSLVDALGVEYGLHPLRTGGLWWVAIEQFTPKRRCVQEGKSIKLLSKLHTVTKTTQPRIRPAARTQPTPAPAWVGGAGGCARLCEGLAVWYIRFCYRIRGGACPTRQVIHGRRISNPWPFKCKHANTKVRLSEMRVAGCVARRRTKAGDSTRGA
jgi:hypothetical protein